MNTVEGVRALFSEARRLHGHAIDEITATGEELAGVVNGLSADKQRVLDATFKSHVSSAESYDSQYITEIETIQSRFNKSLFDFVNTYTNEIEEIMRLYKAGSKLNSSEYRRKIVEEVK